MNRGIWSAIGAYTLWGWFPVYFKWLAQVPAPELIGHRIVWSCLMLGAVILVTRRWQAFRDQALKLRVIRAYLLAALLISVNWLVYVWAVNSGFILEASLGYFINPLISVLMGVVLLHEKLRPWQWVAVALAILGVVYLTFAHGSLPWIALVLAFSFALYGLIKKTSPLGALHGLTLETGILLLPALGYLFFLEGNGQGAFLHAGTLIDILLIGCGLVTAVPLLLFAAAAQRIPLALLGVLQYIAPTLQFLIAILIYREPFATDKLIGFGIIWMALAIFAVEGLLARRTQAEPAAELM
ncbi:MAG: EamA family transporter RarD [Sterolibacterium sp.]|jgi:chloramphenicol-sensitive protein RarD